MGNERAQKVSGVRLGPYWRIHVVRSVASGFAILIRVCGVLEGA